MGVVIQEVEATTVEPPPAALPQSAPARQDRFDPEMVRALIRRDMARRDRLVVD